MNYRCITSTFNSAGRKSTGGYNENNNTEITALYLHGEVLQFKLCWMPFLSIRNVIIKACIVPNSICTNLWAYFMNIHKPPSLLPHCPSSAEGFSARKFPEHTVLLQRAIREMQFPAQIPKCCAEEKPHFVSWSQLIERALSCCQPCA